MANKLYEENDIRNAIYAIRRKTGKSYKFNVSRMESEIDSIPTKADPKLQEKTATSNGTVTADSGFDGLSKVHVSVPDKAPKLQDKTITENGTYQADNGYDGLGSVTVEVANSGGSSGGVLETFDNVHSTTIAKPTITCTFSTELSS